jgi:hypothetical protein
MTSRIRRKTPVKKLYPSQVKAEWKSLGRRAIRLWKLSAGLDPEIDKLFKRMDACDRAMAREARRQRREASVR